MARVLLVEPYYGGSHRAWADGWVKNSRHEISLLTLPDRFWRWRMRGSAVPLAEMLSAAINQHGRPDLIVVSDMTDVASLLGLARRSVADVPVAMYLHENQLLYPPIPGQSSGDAMALANWRSMLAVDELWFNSSFHRSALLDELPVLLQRQPEPTPPELLARLQSRSRVLWPGVDTRPLIGAPRGDNQRPLVLWNQRWDHDKNPRLVFTTMIHLASQGVPFDLVLAGENTRPESSEFDWVHEQLADRIVSRGYLERSEYLRWLRRADVVVSAADHEFFGIAIVEAIASGAVPVLPRRLSFPELIGKQWHESALYPEGELTTRLTAVLDDLVSWRERNEGLRQSMERFDWANAADHHDAAVLALVGDGGE